MYRLLVNRGFESRRSPSEFNRARLLRGGSPRTIGPRGKARTHSRKPPGSVKRMERWHAIYVRSNCEEIVEGALTYAQVEHYWPSVETIRNVRRGKKVVIRRSLFPGYIFARFEFALRRPIITIPQVVHVLGDGRGPLEDSEVEAVRLIAAMPTVTAAPTLALLHEVGESVVVTKGPLAGLEGQVVYLKNSTRLVISVQMLRQSVSAEVDADWLRKIPAAA